MAKGERQLARLEKRVAHYLRKVEKQKRMILSNKDSDEAEDIREWLEQWCKGRGLDICCGNFPISDTAITVDGDDMLVGIDWYLQGDELHPIRGNEVDYIVTNYFDVFPHPLHVLQQWHRGLKEGGCLAFACANADLYDNVEGALSNGHRAMAYTENPIRHLLGRAGFERIAVTKKYKNLLVVAYKKTPVK